MNLENKTALVTASTRGIGLAIVERFARADKARSSAVESRPGHHRKPCGGWRL